MIPHRAHLASLSILLVVQVTAQTTNATCNSNSTTSWMFNAQGELPCLVWSKLQSLCLPSSQYVNIPPLTGSSFAYNAPESGGTLCQCNVVAYGLMAGCSYCQLGHVASYVTEEEWRSDCTEYNNTSFAQTSLSLPSFAFTHWNGTLWDPEAAKGAGPITVSPTFATLTLSRAFTSTLPSSSAHVSTPASATPLPSSNTTEGSSEGSGEEKSRLQKYGPIIGGVAGGLVLLAILLILWRWHRTRRAKYGDPGLREGSQGGSFPKKLSVNALGGGLAPQRTTWSIINAFSSPRPAPDPLRYTTTQQRLAQRPYTLSSSEASSSSDEKSRRTRDEDSVISGGLPDLRHLPAPPDNGRSLRWAALDPELGSVHPSGVPSHGLGVIANDQSWSSRSSPDHIAQKEAYQPILPAQRQALTRAAAGDVPQSIDFSVAPSPEPKSPTSRGINHVEALSPGPLHIPPMDRLATARAREGDESVLPSLYEPRTGAPTFYNGEEGRASPESRYPTSARPDSKDSRFARRPRDSVPSLPRGIR